MAKQDLATVEPIKAGVPALSDYAADAGAGFENQTREDYSIPFLAILQSTSPQVGSTDGAIPGKLINTVTGDILDGKKGIVFVPSLTQHVFVEWIPRDAGGGFVAVHQLDSDVVKKAKAESEEFGKYVTADGQHDLVETFYVYGLRVVEPGVTEQMVVGFSSTKIKKYKAWMSKANMIQIKLDDGRRINPALFAHRYVLKTVKEKNKHGEFFNFEISFDGTDAASARLPVSSTEYVEARSIREAVSGGRAKAAHDSQNAGGDGTDGAAPF